MKTLFVVALASLFLYSHGFLNTLAVERPTLKSTLDAIPTHERSRAFVVRTLFTTAAIALGVDSTPADARENVYVPTSSIHISADVKILDMSLPTYGDIAQPKYDVDKIKGVDEVLTASKPSMRKTSKKERAAKTEVQEESSKSSSDESKPTMRKSSRKERPSKTEVQEESKSSSDESKGPGKYEILDMSMPSYSESTTKKEKSVFSL